MPQLGETIVEGTILKWLKQEGDAVAADEPLFEISTDKVDTEVPSPVAGTVTKLLVAEGATVPVGTAVMEIDDGTGARAGVGSEGGGAAGGSTGPDTSSVAAAAPVGPPPTAPVSAAQAAPGPPAAAAAPAAPAPVAVAPSPVAVADRGPRSQILSPIVRRLAKERGIDLATVVGSGEGGRITKTDVLAAAGGAAPAAAALGVVVPATTAPAVTQAPASAPAGTGEDVQPMSHIRTAIATHMLASVNETARAWTMVEVNVERLVRLRTAAKDGFQEKYGVKLTYLPMVTRATVDALREFPLVNSRVQGADIVTPRFVNMGIAVSYDAGLIVPVIKGVDAMNTVGIARAIADMATRARAHQLRPDEVQGATFTITNPGPYGSLVSVPIINQPNAGILSLDAIQKRPVVVEEDAIAVRHMVYISMSWDHRLIDGELATRFLARVKHNLESWDFAEDLGL
jgi:2-oxoglutarate dehydrogenase E2 component (dihydrolipoamide succinyltransferase)